MKGHLIDIPGSAYSYYSLLDERLTALRQRVTSMRALVERLSGESLERLQAYFRLKHVYNSNAIEGNSLSMGETKLVIQQGLTITGKPLKDTVEAKNLANALDLFEQLAGRDAAPISLADIRNIHRVILTGIDDRNAGSYRSVFVRISGSKYAPPDPARIESEMNAFGSWLASEAFTRLDPLLASCCAHVWFVTIHPFIDGNGRTARLLMNLVLLRAGYPLVILTKDDRQRYYDALEESHGSDLSPFIELVYETAEESFEIYEAAASEQLSMQQFVANILEGDHGWLQNEYDLFEGAMRLLRASFQQVTSLFNDHSEMGSRPLALAMKDFGMLEFEKYQSFRQAQSAKKTWFFRLTFQDKRQDRIARYLFFFSFASAEMRKRTGENSVSVHVATEVYKFYYEKTRNLPEADVPSIVEIAYSAKDETFVRLDHRGELRTIRAEECAQIFIREGFEQLAAARP